MSLTPVKKETIKLIHLGYRNLQIADEIANKFDLLGSEQNELHKHIEATRKEIIKFRAEAPTLAELGFQNGYTWKEVVSALEAPGLLSGFEITNVCVSARNRVNGVQVES